MCQTRERVLRDGQEDTTTPLLLFHFFPWKATLYLQSFTCSLPEASAEQPAELDRKNEGKKEGQTEAELHRDCGGSTVGILPVEIHVQQWEPGLLLAARCWVAVGLLLQPSCARNEALD